MEDERAQLEQLAADKPELEQEMMTHSKKIKAPSKDVKAGPRQHKALNRKVEELQSDVNTTQSEKDLRMAPATLEKEVAKLKRSAKSAKIRYGKKLKQNAEILDETRAQLLTVQTELEDSLQREKLLTVETLETSQSLSTAKERLNHTAGKLYEVEQQLASTTKELLETQRAKDAQDTTIEMESLRASMVEDQYSADVRALQNRLNYFERAPLRAGLKSFLFSTLRSIRRGLPLPELFKLRMAQKLTGLAVRLQPPIEQVQAQTLPMNVDASIDFSFQEVEAPVISIIVPVFNEISQTIACLKSIRQQHVSVSYEVIVADDASTDPFHKIFNEVPGLRVVRQPENLHFLLNCNRAAEHARGEYLVFLNNDTIVKPGWLETLLATFREHANAGVVGSKLVYPTGKLQEAGGIIWDDASGWNWGKGQNADHPLYNFVRDVDYVSGASLMIPTDLWREIGGFNEDLEKAYYEDTDLCFRVRDMGYRVIYQPASIVVHIEGLTSGSDLNAGAKKYQLVNQDKFKDRWSNTLKSHLPNAQTPHLASDRKVKGHVLYIDAVTPEPDKDSGALDAIYAMSILTEEGYRVHFVPGSNFAYWGKYTQALQKRGIECVYHPFYSNLDMFIDERGDIFDFVVVSRAESGDLFFDKIRERLPSAKLIYNTVDLHFLRMQRSAEMTKAPDLAIAADLMRARELSYIEQADATIILSSAEKKVLTELGASEEKLWLIPLIRPESERLVEYEATQDMVFIGGYRHPPNVDAVDWMMAEIWPRIEKALPGVKLKLCGSSMPDRFQAYASDSVIVQGFVPDLNAVLSKTRLTLAPLRFGAGLKGKVASSIGVGVPVVGTSIAFEGMAEDGLADVILEADDPQTFADLAVRVYTDEGAWTPISNAGVVYHNENYAFRKVAKQYVAMLKWSNDAPLL